MKNFALGLLFILLIGSFPGCSKPNPTEPSPNTPQPTVAPTVAPTATATPVPTSCSAYCTPGSIDGEFDIYNQPLSNSNFTCYINGKAIPHGGTLNINQTDSSGYIIGVWQYWCTYDATVMNGTFRVCYSYYHIGEGLPSACPAFSILIKW